MRLLAAALFSIMSLTAADFPIDHVTICGSDLRQMQIRLSSIGIASVFGGAHRDGVTEMALVSFPDGSYLELIALQKDAAELAVKQHPWGKSLAGDGGPCAWAVRAPDLQGQIGKLRASGTEVSEPAANGRERPDGVRLDWVTANIGPDARGTFFPFLIHDSTQRDLRAFPQGKPGNRDFRGVTRVILGVRDLDAATARYRKAFGLPEAHIQVDTSFGARLAIMGDAPIILAEPLKADSRLAVRLAAFGEAPVGFILGTSRSATAFHARSRTRWFSTDFFWFDDAQLGWRLGFEKVK